MSTALSTRTCRDSEDPSDERRREFERHARGVGVNPNAYGRTINLAGAPYRVSGIDTTYTDHPVRLQGLHGGPPMQCSVHFLNERVGETV